MDVRLIGTFLLLSPLSHIGESISATSYLVEEPVIQADGELVHVFTYSGNAWRGQLRDLSAMYLLDALGSPKLGLEAFHMLFAGGKIGGEQSTNIEQARQWRRALPHVSLWGGGVGNQILPGKLRIQNCYPLVQEAMRVLPAWTEERAERVSYSQVTFEKSFSRKDDSKDERLRERLALPEPAIAPMPAQDDAQVALLEMPGEPPKRRTKGTPKSAGVEKDRPEQMRMTVELVAAGTELYTEIDILDCSEIELGCLVAALTRFARSPHIGGQANRGHGRVRLSYQSVNMDTGERHDFACVQDGFAELSAPAQQAKDTYDEMLREAYDSYLAANAGEIMPLLGVGR